MITCEFENGNQNNLRHVTVGCIVIKDSRILLAKRSPHLIEGGKWCLLGGFLERDETALEGAVRETLEESGWTVSDISLFRINDIPDRPHEDRQNIDFIFTASAKEQVSNPDNESTELKWFDLDNLPPDELIAFDHLDSIKLYRDGTNRNAEVIYGAI